MSGSWKVAYADFVTAMMAFFLLMWILNMASEDTKEVLSQYFTPQNWDGVSGGAQGSKSGNISGNTGLNLDPENMPVSRTDKTYYAIARKLKESLNKSQIPPEARGVTSEDDGILLHINSNALFETDSTELSPQGEQVLDDVASILQEYNLFLVVRGHTDVSEEEATKEKPSKLQEKYPSKWELSSARATACTRYLVNVAKVQPSMIRAVGYADIKPLVPSTSLENAAKNRRVEFNFHRPEAMGGSVGY